MIQKKKYECTGSCLLLRFVNKASYTIFCRQVYLPNINKTRPSHSINTAKTTQSNHYRLQCACQLKSMALFVCFQLVFAEFAHGLLDS